MQTLGLMSLAAVAGYAAGAAAGYFLTMQLSSNRHDRRIEAATTGGLVFGPLAAVFAMILTWWLFV